MPLDPKPFIEIYTDGACSGNPGPGGWGAVLLWNGNKKEVSGYEAHTTNNRMELRAAIEGLKTIKRKLPIKLYTDSIYVKNGITIWIHKWQRSNWNNGKVKNTDLWLELLKLAADLEIEWHWVKGHGENYYNNRADLIARSEIEKNFNRRLDSEQ
jgi:ribonuclease HI